jgi:predicted Zn-dependent peptidase
MGSIKTVNAVTRGTLANYRKDHYTPGRIVVAASGGLSHEKLLGLVKRHLKFPAGSSAHVAPESPNGIQPIKSVNSRDIMQTHVCIGVPTWAFADKRRYPLLLANNVLGGGMSSRLFQTVREKRGLVYSIFAFHDFYQDTGHFGVYLACDPSHTVRAIDLVLKELGKVASTPIPSTELADVKSQLKGNLTLGMESTQARMHRLARHELYLGGHVPVERTMKSIDGVQAREVTDVAQEVFDRDRLAVAIVGPVNERIYDEVRWDNLRVRRSAPRKKMKTA